MFNKTTVTSPVSLRFFLPLETSLPFDNDFTNFIPTLPLQAYKTKKKAFKYLNSCTIYTLSICSKLQSYHTPSLFSESDILQKKHPSPSRRIT